MSRRILYRPAVLRTIERMSEQDRERTRAAIERFARTGHGDVKKLQGRPGQFRLRVGKWRVVFLYEGPDTLRVTELDNRGEAY